MLKQLHIQNYALIEEITVGFPGALTVITGETGAGKSILLGALGLILGERADSSVLNNKQKKCIIEGTFFIKSYKLNSFFTANELDYADETSIRREINADGKSRAFINDTPVTLQLLKQLGEKLIDVHSQHETLFLKETSFQFEVVDSFAGILKEKDSYKKSYSELKVKEKRLKELLEKENKAKKDLDYFTFQFNELEEAALKPGELKELETESATLENAEFIKGNLSQAAFGLNGGEENILTRLSALKTLLSQVSKFGPELEELTKRINSVYIELKELGNDLEAAEEDITNDPNRLEEINSKTDKLNRLLKKHGLSSEEELLKLKDELETNIGEIGSMEKEIER
ncbi:MAG: AAA family ATPase, partial [Bacteroidia bacterium]|nr:AAA family ATPase [Bacteroidia bacterium]